MKVQEFADVVTVHLSRSEAADLRTVLQVAEEWRRLRYDGEPHPRIRIAQELAQKLPGEKHRPAGRRIPRIENEEGA